MGSKPEAYVTLVATDSYLQGAIVLAYSIRNQSTTKLLICLITPGLKDETLVQLHKVYDHIIEVPILDTNDKENLELLGRPELGLTVTKIHLWSMDWLDTILFLDADTMVLKSLDHLFEEYKGVPFAACPDMGWPDCFNSGVFICKPDRKVYNELCSKLVSDGSFDGGDQGLLNDYFNKWHKISEQRLPFIYNVTPSSFYSYAPALKKHHDGIAVMHFIGQEKPWHQEPGKESENTHDIEKDAMQNKPNADESFVESKEHEDIKKRDLDEYSKEKDKATQRVDSIKKFHEKWWEFYENAENLNISKDELMLQNHDKEGNKSDSNKSNNFIEESKLEIKDNLNKKNDLENQVILKVNDQIIEQSNDENIVNHNIEEIKKDEEPAPPIHQLDFAFEKKYHKAHQKQHLIEHSASHHEHKFQSSNQFNSQMDQQNYNEHHYHQEHKSNNNSYLPFIINSHAQKAEHPIMPIDVLKDLKQRDMLTPAHQAASDMNLPFPLYGAYKAHQSNALVKNKTNGRSDVNYTDRRHHDYNEQREAYFEEKYTNQYDSHSNFNSDNYIEKDPHEGDSYNHKSTYATYNNEHHNHYNQSIRMHYNPQIKNEKRIQGHSDDSNKSDRHNTPKQQSFSIGQQKSSNVTVHNKHKETFYSYREDDRYKGESYQGSRATSQNRYESSFQGRNPEPQMDIKETLRRIDVINSWEEIPLEIIGDMETHSTLYDIPKPEIEFKPNSDSLDMNTKLEDTIPTSIGLGHKVEPGKVWQTKITCSSQKPFKSVGGVYQATFTLVWMNHYLNKAYPETIGNLSSLEKVTLIKDTQKEILKTGIENKHKEEVLTYKKSDKMSPEDLIEPLTPGLDAVIRKELRSDSIIPLSLLKSDDKNESQAKGLEDSGPIASIFDVLNIEERENKETSNINAVIDSITKSNEKLDLASTLTSGLNINLEIPMETKSKELRISTFEYNNKEDSESYFSSDTTKLEYNNFEKDEHKKIEPLTPGLDEVKLKRRSAIRYSDPAIKDKLGDVLANVDTLSNQNKKEMELYENRTDLSTNHLTSKTNKNEEIKESLSYTPNTDYSSPQVLPSTPQNDNHTPQQDMSPSTPRKSRSFSRAPSQNVDFGSYRIDWDHPELKSWNPPTIIPTITKSKYKDVEDPHDRRLRRRSISQSGGFVILREDEKLKDVNDKTGSVGSNKNITETKLEDKGANINQNKAKPDTLIIGTEKNITTVESKAKRPAESVATMDISSSLPNKILDNKLDEKEQTVIDKRNDLIKIDSLEVLDITGKPSLIPAKGTQGILIEEQKNGHNDKQECIKTQVKSEKKLAALIINEKRPLSEQSNGSKNDFDGESSIAGAQLSTSIKKVDNQIKENTKEDKDNVEGIKSKKGLEIMLSQDESTESNESITRLVQTNNNSSKLSVKDTINGSKKSLDKNKTKPHGTLSKSLLINSQF